MSLKKNYELMSSYNQWINESIYQAASKLNSAQRDKDCGAFFGSVTGTLNHIIVGDIIWLKRFSMHQENFNSLDYVRDLEVPNALDTIIYPDFNELKLARVKMDGVIVDFTNELTDYVICSSLTYKNTRNKLFTKKLGFLLQHLFNHQTHHRGQVTTLISQYGIDVGATDLLLCIPNE